MRDFAAIDFETANNERTSVCSVDVVIVRDGEIVDHSTRYTVSEYCGYHLANHHHALADAEAYAWIAREIL